ncbi:hypothetical protein [Aquibacillus saliphilus]|uniref:hypothetical protein n=1 Tax=Aquibacillus saliphilus TaxID=1909422 RepID=UPI001CEFFA9E|nr:hypothetical protein [Aquibacillus saliphilus]
MKKYILVGSFIVLMITIVMISNGFFSPKEEANDSVEDVGELDSTSAEQLIESEETELDSNAIITLNVINGEVIIVRDEQETIETNEIQIYPGDIIKTKEDSVAKGELNSQDVFMIGENSSIEMTKIMDAEKGVHIEMNQHFGLVYHMGEHEAYFVNINDFQYHPIGTHFLISIDQETGETSLFVASGIVRTSSIPEPDRFTNVLPSQQLRVPAEDRNDTHPGAISTGDLVMDLDHSILASFIENKTKIDEENERLLELLNSNQSLRGEYGLTTDEDFDSLKENTNMLYEYILNQSIERGNITLEEVRLLVDPYNSMVEDERHRIDMNRDIALHQLVLENQLTDRQLEEMFEEERLKEKKRLQEQLQQRIEQQREENRLAQERAAQEAEKRYFEQLSNQERTQERERESPSQPEIVRPMPQSPRPELERPSNQREEEERQREEEKAGLIQEIEDYLETLAFDSLDLSEGVENIDLIDLYAIDERIEATVQVDDLKVATVSIEDSQLQVTPIRPGETKLLFKVRLENDAIVKAFNIKVVMSIPSETADAVEFIDTNPLYNEIVPEIMITKAEDETYLTNYVLFWADEQRQKLGESIAILEKTGKDIHYILPEGIEIPNEAKGILVFSKNNFGLSHVSVYTPIDDYQAYSIRRKLNNRQVIENDYFGLELSGIFIDPFGEEVDFYGQMYRIEAISSGDSVKVENMDDWIRFEGVNPGEATITLNLYYAEELLASTAFNVTVREIILPKYGPSFIEYTVDNDEITFRIGKAEDESDIFGYLVYWSNIDNERLGIFTGFGVTGSDMQFTLSRDAIYGTRIHVVTYNDMGESEEFVSVDTSF